MSLQKLESKRETPSREYESTHAEIERGNIVKSALAIIEDQWLCLGETIASPRDASDYFKIRLATEKREVFAALFLTSKHQVIHFEILFGGTIDSSPVYPRVVAQKALELNAAAIIVGHNHPSGVAEPSTADQSITKSLNQALSLFDIKLLDHFIVAQGESVSMAERGMLGN